MKFSVISVVILLAGLFSVNIVMAGQNRCLPEWSVDSPILIDKDIGRIEFAQGDTFSGEANYRYSSNCKDYVAAVLTWQALKNNVVTNDIVFSDSHAKKTTATVVLNAKIGDRITIRGILTFTDEPSGVRSEREESIFLVSKSPASKIVPKYGPVESFKSFSVSFEGSKAYGSGNNFIRNCSLVLKDEQGNIVDTDEIKTVFGKAMPQAQLTAKNPGIHTIVAVCSDSHGTIGMVSETIPVDLGNKDKKSSPLLIINETLSCYLGDCIADFSQTNAFGKSLSVKYYDITNGDTRNAQAILCGAQACKLNITRPGFYKIKLEARFLLSSDANGFRYSDKSEAVVSVTVTAGQGYALTAAKRQMAATPIFPCPPEDIPDYRRKSSPGINFFASIFTLIIMARKIKKQL